MNPRQSPSRSLRVAVLCCTLVLAAAPATRAQSAAAVPLCRSLGSDLEAKVQGVFESLHPYDGCDETFAKCLARKPPHPVVLRLAEALCRQVKEGRSRSELERSLTRRAQSVLPLGKPATFSLDESMATGIAGAPITAVVYVCARCPFCKVFVPELHRELVEGPLKGTVRLFFRPFPLKDHASSTEGGLAILAAARLGAFWPFLSKLYSDYDAFCPKLLPDWAAGLGLERAVFERYLGDPTLRDALVAAKQEGLRNKVEATPTLFLDGRKYLYDLTVVSVVDVLQELLERQTEHAAP